jgi:hypothetical protein
MLFSSLTGPYGLIVETVLKTRLGLFQPMERIGNTFSDRPPASPGPAYRTIKKAHNYNTLRPVTVHG